MLEKTHINNEYRLPFMNMNKEYPYVVVAYYRPLKKRCSIIGRELVAITKKFGLKPFKNNEIKRNPKAAWSSYDLHAEVRMTAVAGSEACGFHQDGDTSTNDMDFAMVVWADREPTEFQYNGKIYQPKRYELVIARNLGCYHRRSPNFNGKRFFFRQRVVVPKHIDLV